MLPKEYMKDGEVACRCGCGKMPDQRSLERLYALRIMYGKPIPINSGVSCSTHNAFIGRSDTSTHLVGAYDCDIPKEDEWYFIKCAMNVGFTGIGIHNNVYIHIDDKHTSPVVWTY